MRNNKQSSPSKLNKFLFR